MIFQLDSNKKSFGLDNVPKFIRIEAAIVKIQCFENQHKLKKDYCILDTRTYNAKILSLVSVYIYLIIRHAIGL